MSRQICLPLSISMQDITERAGVNRATFYTDFPDKYELLDYTVSQGFRLELEKRALNVCTFSMDNLPAMIVTVCEYISTARSHCKLPLPQFESVMETQVQEHVQELIQNRIEKLGTDVNLGIASTATNRAIYGLALQWSLDKSKKRMSVEKLVGQALPLIEGNLRLRQPV